MLELGRLDQAVGYNVYTFVMLESTEQNVYHTHKYYKSTIVVIVIFLCIRMLNIISESLKAVHVKVFSVQHFISYE